MRSRNRRYASVGETKGERKMEILIIGAGMMGSAMAVPALEKGHRVTVAGTPLDAEIYIMEKGDGL